MLICYRSLPYFLIRFWRLQLSMGFAPNEWYLSWWWWETGARDSVLGCQWCGKTSAIRQRVRHCIIINNNSLFELNSTRYDAIPFTALQAFFSPARACRRIQGESKADGLIDQRAWYQQHHPHHSSTSLWTGPEGGSDTGKSSGSPWAYLILCVNTW